MNCQSVFFPQNVYILCLYLSKRKLFDLLYLQNVWMLEVCLMYLAVWIVWLIISSECVTAGSLPDVSGSMNCLTYYIFRMCDCWKFAWCIWQYELYIAVILYCLWLLHRITQIRQEVTCRHWYWFMSCTYDCYNRKTQLQCRINGKTIW